MASVLPTARHGPPADAPARCGRCFGAAQSGLSRCTTGTVVARQERRGIMLELRPNCECCDKDLPPAATDAMICTFECTFCVDCVNGKLGERCPNCGGNFSPRPVRPASKLAKFPPSTQRIFKPQGCGQAA